MTDQTFPVNPIIVVGGGLAGLSAAHQIYLRGGNVVLLDKQGFLSGNSGKATSGINGSLTRTQVNLSIKDSVEQFYNDTLATAKERANPELIKVLTYNSADAVHWLQEVFHLDLSVVSRLGGHSQPRTHRGKDSKFPGMAITYKLLETLESLSETEQDRVKILKKTQVIDLIIDPEDWKRVLGVKYKNLEGKSKHELYGPVIMATGGYAADFTKNSLLRKYRPDIIDLPSTNGNHATGDGQKIIMKNKGIGIDLDKVQVHPTGLIDLNDTDAISGKKQPRFLFLGAEALRGEGGILLNQKGERFVNELGTRDYVSEEIEKQIKAGNGPIRLVLNERAESKLKFHVAHYRSRNLLKSISGEQLVNELDCDEQFLNSVLSMYNQAFEGKTEDEFGKKFFPNCPFDLLSKSTYHVSFVARVLHFTMGGVKINDRTEVLIQDDDKVERFRGLFAAGEVAGGVHGHNRLGGSSLLACVVFGKVAADEATSFSLQQLNKAGGSSTVGESATDRLNLISLHIDPAKPQSIVVDWSADTKGGSSNGRKDQVKPSQAPPTTEQKTAPKNQDSFKQFEIPSKEFTAEEVSKHNKADDCWCIIKNVVLDLTSFLSNHPGGAESIINFAGKDATESFEMLHEDNFIVKYVKDCVLGRLKGQTPTLEL